MKFIKKPLFTAISLVSITCVIFFMGGSSTNKSLGVVKPVSVEPLQQQNTQQSIINQDKSTDDSGNSRNIEVVNTKSGGELDDHKSSLLQFTKTHVSEVELEASVDKTEIPFMPKMGNETLKAQLGNASWKLLHTILARYPERPTVEQQASLKQYLHLFAQVYPCGDCARHFQSLLKNYPPQVGSRKTAALWGCDIHNKVNARLKKPDYDCTTILEDYDCGCGQDEKDEDTIGLSQNKKNVMELQIDEKVDGLQRGG